MKVKAFLGMIMLTVITGLALPSCSDDDDPQPTKRLIRFEIKVTPSCTFNAYYGHHVTSYGEWEYEFYVNDLSKAIWFDCATVNNDTALITGKIYVDDKFAVMQQGRRYIDVVLPKSAVQ